MFEALDIPLFQRALIAGLLASLACGVMGAFVVVRQMASISGGVAHAALGGVGLAYFLGFHPLLGAVLIAVLSAVTMVYVYRTQRQSVDTVIAMIWALGMALGIIFIAMTPGYRPSLENFLIGNILLVPLDYIYVVVVLDAVVLAFVLSLFKEFRAVSFDEEFTEIMGVPVGRLLLLLMTLVALTVVILIRIVGVVMLIALLTMPAVIARQWTSSLRHMMLFGVLVSAVAVTSGLFLSYELERMSVASIPTGPLIILLVTILYIVSSIASTFQRKM